MTVIMLAVVVWALFQPTFNGVSLLAILTLALWAATRKEDK